MTLWYQGLYFMHGYMRSSWISNLLWGPNLEVINETSFVVVYISVTVC